ncbi:UDP-glucuronosyltransferase 2A3-like [Macrotis lagotis]|uniref:UDP-glucuronosyltransferase 2A3-like n=1 Tax=Macrotis lagotis TaxID=92651 RepID=UPI003D695C17
MTEKWISILLLLQLCCFGWGSCGKVLVWPLDYSHWLNMKKILEELSQRGHMVTVLIPSDLLLADLTEFSKLFYEIFPVPQKKKKKRNSCLQSDTHGETEKKKTGYDVLLIDAALPGGDLIAKMLEIPFINSLRLILGNAYEKYCGRLPSPPSYVSIALSRLTDKMTFMERVENMLLPLFFDYFWFHSFEKK